ncbi:hypothetical protein Tco_0136570, partial [Tanacetum coccineum]
KSSDDDQDDEQAQDDENADKNDVTETTQDDDDDDDHDDDKKAQDDDDEELTESDEDDDDHDDDKKTQDDDDDDEELTESDDDGDDFVHPKLTTYDDDIIHEEETDEDKSFDPTIHTPSRISSSDDEDSDNEVKGNKAVEDTNTNLDGRDDIITDVILPQSSSVSSGLVSNMLNPNQDTGVDAIFGQHAEAYLSNRYSCHCHCGAILLCTNQSSSNTESSLHSITTTTNSDTGYYSKLLTLKSS